MMPGKRRRWRSRVQYIDNIKKWTKTRPAVGRTHDGKAATGVGYNRNENATMDVRSPKARGDKRRNNLRDSKGGRNL